MQRSDYEIYVTYVHNKAVSLAAELPNVSGLTPAELRAAATNDAPFEEVLSTVRLFQWLLPGLAVNVAFLRAALIADAVERQSQRRPQSSRWCD